MKNARNIGLLLATVIFGCGGGEGSGTTSDDARALVAQMARGYDHALTHRCECLVAQHLLYDSVDACLVNIGWDATGEECLATAFEEHGTGALRSALRCHVGHLNDANACADAVSCKELLLDGACDAASAENPCGDAAIELATFVFEQCPQLDLHSR